uniref:Tudor domain-containing protein n=1 Tax=Globisporangium ultimum (strain ATCC 200006 / CBS 805.95 / DAOM BR144) TaxID=431595 RepID=K3W564_GLOUD
MEGDVIEAKRMDSTMFYLGRIAFCHANGLYDIVFDDGDEDTLVPRASIRLLKPKKKKQKSQTTDIVAVSTATNTRTDVTRDESANNATQSIPNVQERIDAAHSVPLPVEPVAHVTHLPAAVNHQVETQIGDEECARLNKQFGKTAACHTPESSSDDQPERQQRHKQEELWGEMPMSDASASLRNLSSQLQVTEVNVNKHILHITPKVDAGARPTAIKSARRQTSSSCGARGKRMSTAPAALPLVSWKELEEWRNVDLILNRKRRFLNSQSGSIESLRVPWGEEFAAIQSLKRFAAQHPDVLRDHIATQMDEVVGVTLVASSGRDGRACQSTRTPSTEWSSCSSAVAAAGNAREALLLVKDLAFLLKQRLAPLLNVILPTVLPAVFSIEKRFLRDIAYEVLEALVLHCSGRRLVMLLLQHGEACAQGDDLRLFNLV